MIITTQSGLAVVGPGPGQMSDVSAANHANAARCRVGSPGGMTSILKRAPLGVLTVATVGPFAQAGSRLVPRSVTTAWCPIRTVVSRTDRQMAPSWNLLCCWWIDDDV